MSYRNKVAGELIQSADWNLHVAYTDTVSSNVATLSGSYAAFSSNSDLHVDHTGVTLTAGDGLTGGGTIATSRTFTVVGGRGITANADDIEVTDYIASSTAKATFVASGVVLVSISSQYLSGQLRAIHTARDIDDGAGGGWDPVAYSNSGLIWNNIDNRWEPMPSGGSGGGSAGNPAGSDTQIQFNDGGSFGADSAFTWDKNVDTLTVAGAISSQALSGGLITTDKISIPKGINGIQFVDANTKIYEEANTLKIIADDDILLNPDDDVTIGIDGTNYARFYGNEKALYINENGTLSTPTYTLEVVGTIHGTAISGIAVSGGTIIGTFQGDQIAQGYIKSGTKWQLAFELTDNSGAKYTFAYNHVVNSGAKYTQAYDWFVASSQKLSIVQASGNEYSAAYDWYSASASRISEFVASGDKYSTAYAERGSQIDGDDLTWDGSVLDVDDAFLRNDADDTTTGVITSAGFKTTGYVSSAAISGGTYNITSPYTHIVYTDGTNYFAVNGDDQSITENSDAATLINGIIATNSHIVLREGVYELTTALTKGVNNVILEGSGRNTILSLDANADSHMITPQGHYWTIKNMKLSGNYANQGSANLYGIHIDNYDHTSLQNLEFYKMSTAVVRITPGSNYLNVENCLFSSNARHGILSHGGVNHINVTDCNFIDTMESPIYDEADYPSTDWIIKGCLFTDFGYRLSLRGVSGAIMSDCYFDNSAKHGTGVFHGSISLQHVAYATLNNIIVNNSQGSVLALLGARYIDINNLQGHSISSNTGLAIGIYNNSSVELVPFPMESEHITFNGGHIDVRGPATFTVYIQNSSQNIKFKGMNFESPDRGVGIEAYTNFLSFEDCYFKVSGTGYGAIVDTGIGEFNNFKLTNCIFDNCDSTAGAISLDVGRNLIIDGNMFSGCATPIDINNANINNAIITNNDWYTCTNNPSYAAATNTRIQSNIDKDGNWWTVYDNYGWANIANAGTIAHGCGLKPTNISLAPSGTSPIMYSFTADSTNIIVYHSDAGNYNFSWRAKV